MRFSEPHPGGQLFGGQFRSRAADERLIAWVKSEMKVGAYPKLRGENQIRFSMCACHHLRRGHANIVPILTDDPHRESSKDVSGVVLVAKGLSTHPAF